MCGLRSTLLGLFVGGVIRGEPNRADPRGNASRGRGPAPEACHRDLARRPEPGELCEYTRAGSSGATESPCVCDLRGGTIGSAASASVTQNTERVPCTIGQGDDSISERDFAVEAINRSGGGDHPSKVVQVAAEPGHELRATTAVRHVGLGLTRLVGIGEPSRVGLQDRLSLLTPRPTLDRLHLGGQFVVPLCDLLAVRTR
jgi:hypothetical protein